MYLLRLVGWVEGRFFGLRAGHAVQSARPPAGTLPPVIAVGVAWPLIVLPNVRHTSYETALLVSAQPQR
jgi:hypothetical protein